MCVRRTARDGAQRIGWVPNEKGLCSGGVTECESYMLYVRADGMCVRGLDLVREELCNEVCDGVGMVGAWLPSTRRTLVRSSASLAHASYRIRSSISREAYKLEADCLQVGGTLSTSW